MSPFTAWQVSTEFVPTIGATRTAGLKCQFSFCGNECGCGMDLYTKNGRPLQVSGETVYSRSGTVIGRIKGKKVYGTDGRYVGTITGDRLVYRSTDRAGVSSPFASANRAGSAKANRAGSAVMGDEPEIPD